MFKNTHYLKYKIRKMNTKKKLPIYLWDLKDFTIICIESEIIPFGGNTLQQKNTENKTQDLTTYNYDVSDCSLFHTPLLRAVNGPR